MLLHRKYILHPSSACPLQRPDSFSSPPLLHPATATPALQSCLRPPTTIVTIATTATVATIAKVSPTCYAAALATSHNRLRSSHSQKEETSASLYWCVTPEEVEQRILQRKPNQRVGRIPGMYVLCNKVTAAAHCTPHYQHTLLLRAALLPTT